MAIKSLCRDLLFPKGWLSPPYFLCIKKSLEINP
nr:MAG TPA: hypothetical protein [Caudoviricetes sp.]